MGKTEYKIGIMGITEGGRQERKEKKGRSERNAYSSRNVLSVREVLRRLMLHGPERSGRPCTIPLYEYAETSFQTPQTSHHPYHPPRVSAIMESR